MARAKKQKAPTRIWTYGLLPPSHGGEELMRMLRAGHRYGNALLEVERDRLTEVEDFWAQSGGYADLVQEYRRMQGVRLRKDDPGRAAHFAAMDELRDRIRARRAEEVERASCSEDNRRKARAKELKDEARERGEKLSKEQLVRLLDLEPDCVSPRRRAQLDFEAEARARGVEPSGKAMNRYLREHGIRTVTQDIDDRAAERQRRARNHFGVFYGTYLLVEAAVEKAIESSESFPRFKRFEGEGRVGAPVDTNAGLSVASLHDCHYDPERGWDDARGNTVIQIDPNGVRCAKGLHTRARVCVDSLGRNGRGRIPVWVDFRINFDRPLPVGAKICAAWVNIYNVGTRVKYELQLQVQDESFKPTPRHGEGTTAVNFGYRASGRVAYLLNDRREGRELQVDPRIEAGFDRADRARSDRQHAANGMRDILRGWLNELGAPEAFVEGDGETEVTTWSGTVTRRTRSLRTRIAALGDSREEGLSKKLRGIYDAWVTYRAEGRTRRTDEATYAALLEWTHRDRGLENIEAFTRTAARNYRDQQVRDWAHEICDQSEKLLIDGTNYAALKMKPKDKDLMPIEIQTDIARRRDIYSPGAMRRVLEEVASARGVVVERIEPEGLTQRHHACGYNRPWDQVAAIAHRCAGCGVTYDQDRNFCHGLFERSGGRLPTRPARTSRSARNREHPIISESDRQTPVAAE